MQSIRSQPAPPHRLGADLYRTNTNGTVEGPVAQRLRLLSETLSGLVAALGVAVLLGWTLDLTPLNSFGPELLVMKANTAVGFLLTGAALWSLQEGRGARVRRAGHACAAVTAAIGAVTLAQYVLGLDLGIDQVLFRDAPGAALTSHPGRMAPNTALGFLTVGLALLSLDRRTTGGWRPADGLVFATALVALLGVIGHLFGINSFLGPGSYTSIAPTTAIALLLASLSAWAARPGIGLMRQLSGDGLGAARARRLLPAVVLLPLVLGWLRLLGERLGAYDAAFGTGLFVVAMVVALAALTLRDARAVDRAAAGLRQAEEEVRRLNEGLERQAQARTADLAAATAAARESEDRFRRAFEQAPMGVALVAPDGRFLQVNRALCDLTGYSRDELLARTFGDITQPDDRDADFAAVQGLLSGEIQTYQREKRYIHKSGRVVWILLVVSLIRDGEGRPLHFISQMQDVTERKRAEEARQRLAAILDATPDFVAIADPQGRVLYMNGSGRRLLGLGPDDDVSRIRVADGHPEWARRLVLETGLPAALRDGVWSGESAFLDADGREIPFSQIILAHKAPDGQVGFLSTIARDLSDRRRLQEMFHQSQKLEAVGRLAGGVAHDFNNLLGVITGYGELMRRQVPEEHPARPRLEQVMKAAERAAGLTRQLLAFSRKQVMQPELLDLNAAVRDFGKMLERVVGEDVEIEVHAAAELGMVKADPTQVDQVLMNLVVNARYAMPKGGHLTIETANAEFDEAYAVSHPPAQPGRFVMLAVSDNGLGMDAETQKHIFEPFFTTKARGEGTGLGLATVYGVVKQSGGYVWVYSEPGRGTTFKIYLPRVEEEVGAGEAVPEAGVAVPGGHETVLVVEDTKDLREMIREVLEERGYTVLAASDGEQALALVGERTGPIELLLTDVVMPKLGGAGLARRVAELRPEIRVLYMSGYSNGAVSRQGVLTPGVTLLEKPFTGDALARAVRQVLRGRGQDEA